VYFSSVIDDYYNITIKMRDKSMKKEKKIEVAKSFGLPESQAIHIKQARTVKTCCKCGEMILPKTIYFCDETIFSYLVDHHGDYHLEHIPDKFKDNHSEQG